MSSKFFTPADVANDYGLKGDTVRMRIRTLDKKGVVFETDDRGHWLISEEQIPLIIEMGRTKAGYQDPIDKVLEKIRKENEDYRIKIKINEDLENAILAKKGDFALTP
ncbi:hypothetical protein [Bacillus sp. 3255]|uniref:hypothetical protein n=1 Tax=Bacillus sp. 3255 TaxID=2817904 RepID=UPI0028553DA7|nr:hypothetical protein [Bacillus sp. 3255]MDR6883558.1 hypothetical protein [Bacillus sp. 3255]